MNEIAETLKERSSGAEQKELLDEASQLLAIFMASAKTAGKKRAKADQL